jgi:hypothetical protein
MFFFFNITNDFISALFCKNHATRVAKTHTPTFILQAHFFKYFFLPHLNTNHLLQYIVRRQGTLFAINITFVLFAVGLGAEGSFPFATMAWSRRLIPICHLGLEQKAHSHLPPWLETKAHFHLCCSFG